MILRLREITASYPRTDGTRKLALDRVSLELDRGQLVGIFGPSGAGKTTLLRIAAGLQSPDNGVVSYEGERLDQMSAGERMRLRRREIACIWGPRPWEARLSVLDHVSLPLLVDRRDRRTAERRAREALLACEAEQYLSMELEELSQGERQRVSIARALVAEPRLLLADGPTSNLSLLEQESIMRLLGSLAREAKVAVLIADSNADELLGAAPIHYLCDGKLIDPEPIAGEAKVYSFPRARSQRAALDA
jgi:putative ABC transport system ATP-binding protein